MTREEIEQQRLNEIRAQSGEDPWKLLSQAKAEIKRLEGHLLDERQFCYQVISDRDALQKENAELREENAKRSTWKCIKCGCEYSNDVGMNMHLENKSIQSKLDVALETLTKASKMICCSDTNCLCCHWSIPIRAFAHEALAKIQEGK